MLDASDGIALDVSPEDHEWICNWRTHLQRERQRENVDREWIRDHFRQHLKRIDTSIAPQPPAAAPLAAPGGDEEAPVPAAELQSEQAPRAVLKGEVAVVGRAK